MTSAWRLRTMSCTACRSPFPMVCADMVHPADILCDACIVRLFEQVAREGTESATVGLSVKVEARMGYSADALSEAIVARIGELREMVRSRAELDELLAKRRGA